MGFNTIIQMLEIILLAYQSDSAEETEPKMYVCVYVCMHVSVYM